MKEDSELRRDTEFPLTSPSSNEYLFNINNRKANKGKNFKNNTVSTTKYNLVTFLPKTLLYQYYRPEKIYYLIMIILENIPVITPIIPISTMVPYLIVLIISIIREGVEDYLRYKYDKELNSEKTTVYRKGEWVDVATESLKIGELVLVHSNSRFPADLILIDSEKDEGVAFIETSTLDGEISLKKKFSPKETAGLINNNGEFTNNFKMITGTCKCEKPNTDIFRFNGVMELTIEGNDERYKIAVDNSQMLLKGAVLKTTKWAVGIVTYTGHDTKLIKNLNKPKIKESKVFKLMTKFVLIVFIIQAVFCFVSAGLNYSDYNNYVYKMKYLPKPKFSPGKDSILLYFSYLIIYKFMIPITLYVTFELVRIIQAYFLWVNTDLYSHYRHKHVSVGTVSIIEELGSVDYIFTDKTGTLTKNKMEMKYCVIGDTCYEYLHKHINQANHKVYNDEHGIITMENHYLEHFLKLEKEQEQNNWIFRDFRITSENDENVFFQFERESVLIKEYWKALSLAHECVAEEKDGGTDYIGLSPDDVVLVKSAVKQGFVLKKLDKASSRKIEILGEEHEFEVLNIFEFSSDRKRLSIIVRDNGQIKMYIKGADSVINKLLTNKSKKEFNEEAQHYVDFFSKSGLRTLYVGMKVIDEKTYEDWRKIWDKAILNLEDKNSEVKKAQELIEKDFYLIGATIVEDRLQDEVPETIRDLRQAGIKIWMITGDKMDTAFNIGISCNLISKDNQLFFVKGENGETIEKLEREFSEFKESLKDLKNLPGYSIIIDSVVLSTILQSEELTKKFIDYSNQAISVICCRVSPLQKSDVVRIMRKYHPNTVNLAIGDGGNDVSMILEANIGII
jgi:phospholipid-transporting ATPase